MKEKKKYVTEREFRGCTSRRVELMCEARSVSCGPRQPQIPRSLRFNIILLMSWDPLVFLNADGGENGQIPGKSSNKNADDRC